VFVPIKSTPWHAAQLLRYSCFPSAIAAGSAGGLDVPAGPEVTATNTIRARPRTPVAHHINRFTPGRGDAEGFLEAFMVGHSTECPTVPHPGMG
jgi:hypothetical protein